MDQPGQEITVSLLFEKDTRMVWSPVQIVNNFAWKLPFLQICYLVSPLFLLKLFLILLLAIIIFLLWASLLKELALGNKFLASLSVCEDFYCIYQLYADIDGK